METLAEAYPKQQARLRELIATYREIGPGGKLALVLLENIQRRAEVAAAAHDTVAMLGCFKEMQECE